MLKFIKCYCSHCSSNKNSKGRLYCRLDKIKWTKHCSRTLHCTALHCTDALHCTALHCTALHCSRTQLNKRPRQLQIQSTRQNNAVKQDFKNFSKKKQMSKLFFFKKESLQIKRVDTGRWWERSTYRQKLSKSAPSSLKYRRQGN